MLDVNKEWHGFVLFVLSLQAVTLACEAAVLRRRNFAGGGSSLGSVVGRINGPLLFHTGNASSEGAGKLG